MKVAAFHVTEERAPFIGSEVQLDAHLSELLFQGFGDAAPQIDVGGLERQAKARPRTVTVGIGEARRTFW